MTDYLDFGTPISFGYTSQYLGKKTCTRREWKDSHAAKFLNAFDRAVAAGQQLRVPAIDKAYSAGGKQIGWCVITDRPYQELLRDMPETDLLAEGGMALTIADFIAKYFKKKTDLEVWVIRFEFIPLCQEKAETKSVQEPIEIQAQEPEQLPWMPLNAIPVPNHNLKVFGSCKTDEHNTPEFITDAARAIMGGIDLDPMSNAIANRAIKAHQIYTKEENGLLGGWFGRVWLNPPFSLADKAVEKLIAGYEHGAIFEAILLIKSAPDTKRHQSLYPYPFCDLNGRLKFEAEGNKQSAPFATVLFYLGTNFPRFRQIMSAHGRVHLGQRLTEELQLENLSLSQEISILRHADVPVPGFPEILSCGKCGGHGCEYCDLGWSHTTNWENAAKVYEAAFDPNDLPPWMEVSV